MLEISICSQCNLRRRQTVYEQGETRQNLLKVTLKTVIDIEHKVAEDLQQDGPTK